MLLYQCKDGDVLDAIIFKHYGRNIVVAGATEYVLSFNQNLSRLAPHLTVDTTIVLPDLPSSIANYLGQTEQIKIFV